MSTSLYRDPHASVEERVENLLALMTLDEKLAQLSCLWSTAFVSMRSFDPNTVAEQMPHGIGQVTRIGASTGLHPQESATLMNAIQQVAVERTRLGIPVIVHEESTGGLCHRDATVFPQSIGLAEVIRTQMMAVGARHALLAGLDMELPAADCYGAPLKAEVEAGEGAPPRVWRALWAGLRAQIVAG